MILNCGPKSHWFWVPMVDSRFQVVVIDVLLDVISRDCIPINSGSIINKMLDSTLQDTLLGRMCCCDLGTLTLL